MAGVDLYNAVTPKTLGELLLPFDRKNVVP
jgi:hypothetical protein